MTAQLDSSIVEKKKTLVDNILKPNLPAGVVFPSTDIKNYVMNSPDPACAYIYDLNELKRNVRNIVSHLPEQAEIFYAIKANSDSEVLSALSSYIHGYEVASAGEVVKVREQQTGKPIAFGGPGKTEKELNISLDHNVELYHIESRLQLERLNDLAERKGKVVSVLLRVNPRFSTPKATIKMGGEATQFGIDEYEVPDVIQLAQSLSAIKLVGFHFHAISNNLNAVAHLNLIEKYLTCINEWKHRFALSLTTLNLGGGIGINYQDMDDQFDWPFFCQNLKSLLEMYKIKERIIFECGRFLSATCGYYICEVTDIKTIQGQHFAILRGGSHHFRLPSSWQHNHPFTVLPVDTWNKNYRRPTLINEPISLCGELCTPKDTLARNVKIDRLQVGDHIVFLMVGAYGWHISHHDFLSHDHPDKIFLDHSA